MARRPHRKAPPRISSRDRCARVRTLLTAEHARVEAFNADPDEALLILELPAGDTVG
jgi:hypothetical protein